MASGILTRDVKWEGHAPSLRGTVGFGGLYLRPDPIVYALLSSQMSCKGYQPLLGTFVAYKTKGEICASNHAVYVCHRSNVMRKHTRRGSQQSGVQMRADLRRKLF